jgi:hypothetical protein
MPCCPAARGERQTALSRSMRLRKGAEKDKLFIFSRLIRSVTSTDDVHELGK